MERSCWTFKGRHLLLAILGADAHLHPGAMVRAAVKLGGRREVLAPSEAARAALRGVRGLTKKEN